jgi:hypothetical protein
VPLPEAHLLDKLATAYVQAMAAVAGATIAVSRRDYGVDGTIKHIATTEADGYFETGYPVEFQLKGTTLAIATSEAVKYDLKVRNYNLIVTRRQTATPYYLFLVCFGSDVEKWVVAEAESLVLNASAYWWTDFGPRSENTASVRVEIPMTNRLTFGTIEAMLGTSQTRFVT